jgi:hypothetical protein
MGQISMATRDVVVVAGADEAALSASVTIRHESMQNPWGVVRRPLTEPDHRWWAGSPDSDGERRPLVPTISGARVSVEPR